MKINVATHQGVLYNEVVDYFVIHSSIDGEFAVMENHVPVISVMNEGYVKLVRGNDSTYISIVSGIVKFANNDAQVLVQEASIGSTLEESKQMLEEIRKERQEQNRKETVDFTEMEKELRDNLKNMKAGTL